jgi:hypothetical protein
MDASFRPKSSSRGLLLRRLAWPPLLALSAVGVLVSLTHPKVEYSIAAAFFLGGLPLFLASVAICELRFFERQRLTICGDHVSLCGVFQRTEIDLKEVAEARWRPVGNTLLLRTLSTKVAIQLSFYEHPEQEVIVRHLHSVLDQAVQTDWNLFVYKRALHAPKPARTKAGPDEVVVNRSYWDRRLVPFGLPFVIVAAVVGVVAWRMTGDAKNLGVAIAAPVPILCGWLLLRYQIPAEGRVDRKVSSIVRSNQTVRFMLLWTLLFLLALALLGVFRRRLEHPDVLMIGAELVWGGCLIWEMVKKEHRDKKLDRELADLAAKDRGEPRADTWGAE